MSEVGIFAELEQAARDWAEMPEWTKPMVVADWPLAAHQPNRGTEEAS